MTNIEDIDILFGRGPKCYNHQGNKMFREIIKRNAVNYHPKAPKLLKTACINEIFSQFANTGCRFLVRSSEQDKSWIEASDEVAKKKISHAFRDYRKDLFDTIEMPGSKNLKRKATKTIQPKIPGEKESRNRQEKSTKEKNFLVKQSVSHELHQTEAQHSYIECTEQACPNPYKSECIDCCIDWLNELPLPFLERLMTSLEGGSIHSDRKLQNALSPSFRMFQEGLS
jgi:hypothetical protein